MPVKAYYPSTLWSSERINESLLGVRVGNVTGEGRQDLVAIGPRRLMVYRLFENQPFKIVDYRGKRSEEWIKLSLFDLDTDGIDEILISGFRNGLAFSIVGKISDKKLVRLKEVDYFLTVIPWVDHDFPSPLVENMILVGQKSFSGMEPTGPLMKMVWNGNDFVQKKTIKLPGGLSGKSLSLYSLSGIELPGGHSGFVYLSDTGKIILYRIDDNKYRKKWSSGESYGGTVFQIDRDVRNALGGEGTDDFNVPVAMQVESGGSSRTVPMMYIPKNTGYLGGVIGATPAVKNTQMVRLVWSSYGFQEEWNSPRLDGAISDFYLFDWDSDGTKEIVASFLLRDGGFADTLKRQDSLIIVLSTGQ